MSRKVDEGVCVFGALTLEKSLGDLQKEAGGVRDGASSDPVHDMRVASRRLRDALPVFQGCFPKGRYNEWKNEIRKVTRALGAARDTDVQLETLILFESTQTDKAILPGIRRLILRLRQKRAQYQQGVLTMLEEVDRAGFIEDVQSHLKPYLDQQNRAYLYTPALYVLGFESISRRLETFLSYEPYVTRPECIEELHAMRIAAKHLRYTMEIFSPIYPGELKTQIQTLRKNQDLLGEIHDCDVWESLLQQFIDQERQFTSQFFGNLRGYRRIIPGIECFRENRGQVRKQKYEDFLTYWNRQKDEQTWQKVLPVIQMPFFKNEPAATVQTVQAVEKKG